MTTHHHARARFGAITASAAAFAAGAILIVAAPAAAHVHVDGDAEPGARATVSFRVPTESDTASTTSLVVTLPLDTPITSVRPKSMPGWDIEVTHVDLDSPVVVGDLTITSAVGTIAWTAIDGGVAPGEFDEFVVQLGPIPDVPELVLPTLQGYSDGTTVDWSEATVDGVEPEHPAPVLAIGTAESDSEADHEHSETPSVEMTSESAPDSAPDQSGTTAFVITGVVTGVLGLIVAVIALVLAGRAGKRS